MAVGLPAKTTYVDGDVFSASDINDTNGTLNLVGQTTNFYAGKNRLLNSDFSINQRNFTSVTTDSTYGFDRWLLVTSGGTCTYSTQAFTPGTAPVAGYEGINFARLLTSGQTTAYSALIQRIEDGRTFAGQTVTVSFWAKAATGTPQVAVNFYRSYGTGGSPSSPEYTNTGVKVTISTSWARYSATFAVPSVSGKTFGTAANSSYLGVYLFTSDNITAGSNSLGVQNATIDFWGVQVEAGSTATAFQTATGTIQGELAACQRYYWRTTSNSAGSTDTFSLPGWAYSSTNGNINFPCPVPMRIKPTSIDFANLQYMNTSFSQANLSAVTIQSGNNIIIEATITSTSLSSGMIIVVRSNGSATGFIGFSAEL
jgi:ribosomal protein L27